ncbi:unnamed protein product [Hapterophycus canaliculatus]
MLNLPCVEGNFATANGYDARGSDMERGQRKNWKCCNDYVPPLLTNKKEWRETSRLLHIVLQYCSDELVFAGKSVIRFGSTERLFWASDVACSVLRGRALREWGE